MTIIATAEYPLVNLDRENIETGSYRLDGVSAEITFEKVEKIAQHSVKYLSVVPHSIHLEMSNNPKQYSAVIRSSDGNNYRVMLSYKRYAYLKKQYKLPESDKWGEIDSSRLDHPSGYDEYEDESVQNPLDGLEI